VLDLACLGQRQHFGQVVVVAPERTEVRVLPRHQREERHVDAVADQADRRHRPFGGQQCERQADRILGPRALDHRVDFRAPREFLEFGTHDLGRLVAHVDRMVGAVVEGHLQLVVAAAECDDVGAGSQQLGVLDAVAAEAPDATDCERAPGA
jgi:hypothetical protein